MSTSHYTVPVLDSVGSGHETDTQIHPPLSPLTQPRLSFSLRDGMWRDSQRIVHGGTDGCGPHDTATATCSAWAPSRLTSPYRVLSAASMRDDFYTSSLSWGREYVALTLKNELLLFHSHHPREKFAVFHFDRPHPDLQGVTNGPQASPVSMRPATRRPTSVAVSRQSDSTCFVGLDDGSMNMFHARGDSTHLVCGHAFTMPTPPTAALSQRLVSARAGLAPTPSAPSSPYSFSAAVAPPEAQVLRRMEQTVQHLASSLASISTIDTTAVHPWQAAVGTSASGALTLDARQPQPCGTFRHTRPPPQGATSGASTTTATPTATATRALRDVATFLEQQERLCAVRWNASGSMLAVGDDRGVVQIWSLAQPRAPLQTIVLEHGGTARAIAFHPTNPTELLVGCGTAGPGGVRLYDLSSASPEWIWSGHTTAPTTQVLYSPDGTFLLTAGGEVAPVGRASQDGIRSASRRGGSRGDIRSADTHQSRAPWDATVSTLESAAMAFAVAGEGVASSSFTGGEEGDGGASRPPQRQRSPSPLASSGASYSPLSPEWAVSHALTVWKRGAPRGSHDMLREAVLDRATHAPARWDDLLRQPMSHSHGRSSSGHGSLSPADSHDFASPLDPHMRTRHDGAADGGVGENAALGGVPALMPQYTLRGHTSRPLHLAMPYSPSRDSGCVTSAAAGEDGTLRFWRVFTPRNSTAAGGSSRINSQHNQVDREHDYLLDAPLR